MTTLREAALQALEYLDAPSAKLWPAGTQHRIITTLRAALAEPVQEPDPDPWGAGYEAGYAAGMKEYTAEPVACEPQFANDDGWCDWVCPKPIGYLMQCCDCGLIHEVESRVAKYQPRPSEEFEVVDDPDLEVQFRMKRRDDISPKRLEEPVAWSFEVRHIDSAWGAAVSLKHPGPEGVYMRKVTPLYTAPPQRPAEPVQEEKLGKRAIKAVEAALAQVEKETAHAAKDWHDTTQMGYVVKPYTAPPQRKPLKEWQINDLMSDIDPEDVCGWSFRQGVYAAEKHHGIKP